MSELTQTQLNALVTAYGQAAARAARAPRNTSAARCAFEVENAACASLLAAIVALVDERDGPRGEKDYRTCRLNSRDFCLSTAQCVGGNLHVASTPVRRWEVAAKAGELAADGRGLRLPKGDPLYESTFLECVSQGVQS